MILEKTKTKILEKLKIYFCQSNESICSTERCLVNWYLSRDENNICSDAINYSSDYEQKNKFEKYKDHKIFNLIILNNLKFLKFTNINNEKLKQEKKDQINYFLYSKKYLTFLTCIDYDKKNIINFDMDAFITIFNYDYIDSNIINFIENLINDKMLYELKNKQNFIVILIYALSFCKKFNLNQKNKLLEKIKTNIYMMKSAETFIISQTNDLHIDKYIINIKKFENFKEESNFLNFFYQNYIFKNVSDRDLLKNFINRLQKNMQKIDAKYLTDFLKNVFIQHSVFFNTLNDQQIYKTFIDIFNKKIIFYKNEALNRQIYILYNILLLKIKNIEIFNFTILYIYNIIDTKSEYFFKFSIFKILYLDEFYDLIETHCESYNNTKLVLEFLDFCTENTKNNELKKVFMLLELYLKIHDIIKIEFLFKCTKLYFKNIKILLNLIFDYKENKLHVLNFFNKYTDNFSKIILTLERYVALDSEDVKKEKKKSRNSTVLENFFLNFVDIIYKLEEKLIEEFGINNVQNLKSRSFKIKKVNE